MVEDDSTSDSTPKTNKGVNCRSQCWVPRIHSYTPTETSESNLSDIRHDIRNVLDTMGPSTPILTITTPSGHQNTSSEADNESSVQSTVKETTPSVSSDRRSRNKAESTEANVGTLLEDLLLFEQEEEERSCCEYRRVERVECLCGREPIRVNDGTTKSTRMTECKKRNFFEWLKSRSMDVLKKTNSGPCELYKINICGQEEECGLPRRVVFDLVDGIPKPSQSNVATNTIRNPVERTINSPKKENDETKNIKNEGISGETSRIQKNIYYDSDGNKRVDYYYFDHGNAQYFNTTDTPPVLKTEMWAEKTERYTTRFWAEFFASIHIAVSFCVSFILQLFKFILYSMLRPLVVGCMQMLSDYFFKPCLTTSFNGLIQPFLIFLYNIATSIRDLCDPIAETFGYFCREVAVIFRAIRMCTYKRNDDCECNKKNKCQC